MIIVVGGHSRKIGKSSVVAGLIAAFRSAEWTAVKITSHRHESEGDDPYELTEETEATASDTGRYLKAGAKRAFLLRASGSAGDAGGLKEAMPRLERILQSSSHAIIESNRIVGLLKPDLYLLVVDPSVADWKESATRHLGSADALVVVGNESGRAGTRILPSGIPRFAVGPPGYISGKLIEFVADRLTPRSGPC